HRRLFLLAPYAMIVGLIAYMVWPELPDFWPTVAVGLALSIALALCRNRLVTFRLTALALCVWFGFALLAIHGALFGTAMLQRPLYGTYEARIDEILLEAESGVRVIVSNLTPVGDARPAPMRRARIVVSGGSSLAPGDVI